MAYVLVKWREAFLVVYWTYESVSWTGMASLTCVHLTYWYAKRYLSTNLGCWLIYLVDVWILVELMLKATGDAPILNKRKWAVERVKKVAWILDFIQRQIKCSPGESVVSWSAFSLFHKLRRKFLVNILRHFLELFASEFHMDM